MVPSPTESSCVAFLLRHGATDSNLANPPILQGRAIDGPLSATGQMQAVRAAEQLAGFPLKAIYCSPLLRAQETAAALAHPHRLEPRLCEEITEVDVGLWERRSWVEIRETEPEAYRLFQSDPAHHGYRGGENLNQVRDRVVPAITQMMRLHVGQMIAIVGHNVVNRALLAHLLDLPMSRARNIHQDNCGINVLWWQNDEWKAVAINSLFHLAPALPRN